MGKLTYAPTCLADRVTEARAAARFAKVEQRDRQGRPRTILVPGHNMVQYRVIVRHHEVNGQQWLSAECHKMAGPAGYVPCNGNLSSVCYHSMAAVIVVADEMGYDVMFSDNLVAAKRLKNLGGATELRSHQNGKSLFFAYKRQEVADADEKAA